MIRTKWPLLSLTLVVLFAGALHADVHVYVPFPTAETQTTDFYTSGVDLDDSHNKSVAATEGSFTGNWNHGYSQDVMAEGLSYCDPADSSRRLITNGGSVRFDGSAYQLCNRFFKSSALTETTYFSVLLRLEGLGSWGTATYGLGYTTGSGGVKSLGCVNIDMTTGELKGRCYETVDTNNTITLKRHKTYLVVGKVEFDVDGNGSEKTTIWVNPRLVGAEDDIEAEQTMTVTATPTYAPMANAIWSNSGGTSSATAQLSSDEIRIATTFREVMPFVDGAAGVHLYEPFPAASTQTTGKYTVGSYLDDSHNRTVPATIGAYSGNWNQGGMQKVIDTSLSYTDPVVKTRTLKTSGGAVDFDPLGYQRTNRFIKSNPLAQTTYFSVLVEPKARGTWGSAVFGLGYTTGSGAVKDQAAIFIDQETGELTAKCYETSSTDSIVLDLDTTYFIAGKLEFNVDGNGSERVTVWVNPRLGAPERYANPAKKIVVTATPTYTPVANAIWSHSGGTTSTSTDLISDEARVADSWAAVTPYRVTKPNTYVYESFPTATDDTFGRFEEGVDLDTQPNKSMDAFEGEWAGGGYNHSQSWKARVTGLGFTDTTPTPDLRLIAQGGSLEYVPYHTIRSNRKYGNSALTGTTYFSMLIHVDDYSTSGSTGNFGLGYSTGVLRTLGCFTFNTGTGEVKAKCYETTSSGSYTLQEGQTYLIVGKIEFDASGTQEKTTVYVNPSLGEREADITAAATLTAESDIVYTSMTDAWFVMQGANTADADFNIDEIRIATSFEAVTPCEPVSSGYLDVTCEWETVNNEPGIKVTNNANSQVLMQPVGVDMVTGNDNVDTDLEMITEGVEGGFDLVVTCTNNTDYPQQLPKIYFRNLKFGTDTISYVAPYVLGKKYTDMDVTYYVDGNLKGRMVDNVRYPNTAYSPIQLLWDDDFALGASCQYDIMKTRSAVYLMWRVVASGTPYYVMHFDLSGESPNTGLHRIPGDMDKDGDVDNDDATVFTAALSDKTAWKLQYGGLNYGPEDYGDFNGDGRFTSDDQAGFDTYLSSGPGTSIRGKWLPSGEMWTFVLTFRFTEPASHMMAIEPYRQFFKAKYGPVQYAADREPVFGNHCVNSNHYDAVTNPRAYHNSWRMDLNGWETWVDTHLYDGGGDPDSNDLDALGYTRFMIWQSPGRYEVGANFASELMTEWSTAMTNSVDEFDRMRNAGVDNVDFWWGRASQCSGGWNTGQQWIRDITNATDVEQATDELDLCVTRDVPEVGLDAYKALNFPDRYVFMKFMQSEYPSIRFITESYDCDIMHTLAPTFTLYSKQPKAAACADWLNPGHESWIFMRGSDNTQTHFDELVDWGVVPVSMYSGFDH